MRPIGMLTLRVQPFGNEVIGSVEKVRKRER
jgi:hypothetical protein